MNKKTLIQIAHIAGTQIATLCLGKIMTSIVIKFVCLVAQFTLLEKLVNYIRKSIS